MHEIQVWTQMLDVFSIQTHMYIMSSINYVNDRLNSKERDYLRTFRNQMENTHNSQSYAVWTQTLDAFSIQTHT